MGALSIWHWLVLLIVIVLVFGTKKLGNLGGDLGAALRDYKQAVKDDEPSQTKPAVSTNPEKVTTAKDNPSS